MEKYEYEWKYDNLVKSCLERLLEILEENKVEKIDFEEKEDELDVPLCVVNCYDGMAYEAVRYIERYGEPGGYDEYRVNFDNGCGYFSNKHGIEEIESHYIFKIFTAVVEAIESGNYEANEK